MMKLRLNTSVEIKGSLQDVPAPVAVRIPIQKKHKPVVKKKQIVGRGQVIAENPSKGAFNLGFVHASIDGMVEDILPDAIVLAPLPAPKEGEEAAVPVRPEPCAELDTLSGEELCRKLLELGVDTSKMHATRTLVVNGLNPEPGVIVSEQLLKDAQATLKAGIQLIEKALKPGTIKLVVAAGKQVTLHGCTTVGASDAYPATIDPLVVYAATGAERPDNVDVISVAELYAVGRVAETKLPLTETVVSVGDKTFRVPWACPCRNSSVLPAQRRARTRRSPSEAPCGARPSSTCPLASRNTARRSRWSGRGSFLRFNPIRASIAASASWPVRRASSRACFLVSPNSRCSTARGASMSAPAWNAACARSSVRPTGLFCNTFSWPSNSWLPRMLMWRHVDSRIDELAVLLVQQDKNKERIRAHG